MTESNPRLPQDPEPPDLHILNECELPDGFKIREGVRIVKDPTGEIIRRQNEAVLDVLAWIKQ